jgi:hypothetical protein
MTKESEIEKTEKSKRYFLKAILVCVIAIVIIVGVYLGVGAYWAWHQGQFEQNIENSLTSTPTPNISTSTPTISSIPTLTTPTATPNIPVPTPTENVTVQGVTLSASNGVTVYAQSTNSMAVTITSIVVKNTNGDIVWAGAPVSGAILSTGAMATLANSTAVTGVTAGTPYSITIASIKGGSFASSGIVAGA